MFSLDMHSQRVPCLEDTCTNWTSKLDTVFDMLLYVVNAEMTLDVTRTNLAHVLITNSDKVVLDCFFRIANISAFKTN